MENSVILVYIGTSPGVTTYQVESFTYMLGGNKTNRAQRMFTEHAKLLMKNNPLQFLSVPSEASEKVNLLGNPINTITGIFNLEMDDKEALINGGFETSGQLLAVQAPILAGHIKKSEQYARLMQMALKERFGIPFDQDVLDKAREDASKAAADAQKAEEETATKAESVKPKVTRRKAKTT